MEQTLERGWPFLWKKLRDPGRWVKRAQFVGRRIRRLPKGLRSWGRIQTARFGPWVRARSKWRDYHVISDSELMKTRRSDTLYIFGSGSSIKQVAEREWRLFEAHDTLGFNLFVHQSFVRMDYHLVREIGNRFAAESPDGKPDCTVHMPEVEETLGLLHRNPFYAETILIVQSEWAAIGANTIIGRKLLQPRFRVFRYRNRSRGVFEPPSKSFREGLVHGPATLVDCVNFAYLGGWKTIVLVGVDLYDRRYFWLGPDETSDPDLRRKVSSADRHNTADTVVPFLGQWAKVLMREGVELSVYNPKSLLAKVLPVHPRVTP